MYITELMEPLLTCMHGLTSRDSLILLAYYERSATAGRAFWDLLPRYFACKKVPEAEYGVREQPDDVGVFVLRRLD